LNESLAEEKADNEKLRGANARIRHCLVKSYLRTLRPEFWFRLNQDLILSMLRRSDLRDLAPSAWPELCRRFPEVMEPGSGSQVKETPMKYLCLVYGEEREIAALTDDECMAYDHALRNVGRCLASEALQPVQTAATVRVRNGKVFVREAPSPRPRSAWLGSI
jgi:hypothetical protein